MEDLGHGRIGHQLEERRKIETGRERIDDRVQIGPGELNQAELRPEGRFAQEFCIDRDKVVAGKDFAG